MINPRYADAYVDRGLSKSLQGDNQGACADARKGNSLGASKGPKAVELLCK